MPVFKKTDFHSLSKFNEDVAIYMASGDVEGGECNVLYNDHYSQVNVVSNILQVSPHELENVLDRIVS